MALTRNSNVGNSLSWGAILGRVGRGMGSKSVLVVGAGITGVATAEWLRREGWRPTLIDPVMPGSPDQTSYGNAGLLARASVMPVASASLVRKAPLMLFDPDAPLFLRWSYLPRLMPWLLPLLGNVSARRLREIASALAPMTFDTNEQHLALAQGTGAERHIKSGDFLTLYPSKADYDADRLGNDIRRTHGLVPDLLDRAAILERDPHVGRAYGFASRFGEYKWLSDPGRYVADIFGHYWRSGGVFRQARVIGITPGERPLVALEGGEVLSAAKIVITAGAWSGPLAKSLGIRMRLEAERGYHLSIKSPDITAPQPYMLSDAKVVVTPMEGALRGAGVVEFAGIDGPASQAPVDLIRRALNRLYPDLEIVVEESWMGRRPTTPDSLPVLGAAKAVPNVIHAYGGQHVGMTIGPKLGRLVADMLVGRSANMDLAPYSPDRF